jgi:hypothetical protein
MRTFVLYLIISIIASVSGFAQTEKNRVLSYEGFDYYDGIDNNITSSKLDSFLLSYDATTPPDPPIRPKIQPIGGPIPASYARQTENSKVAVVDLSLHTINTLRLNTNSPFSLGWAGDWQMSDLQIMAPANGGYYVGMENSLAIRSLSGNQSLINTGFYLNGGKMAGVTAGRRLQTSTAGFFYEYNTTLTPMSADYSNNPSTLPISSGAIFTGVSPSENNSLVRALDNTVRPNYGSVAGNPKFTAPNIYEAVDHPYPTAYTCIGPQGKTVWFSLLMRKNDLFDDDPCFVTLHKNADVYDNTGDYLSVGYFGTESNVGADKYWGVRVGNAPGSVRIAPSPTTKLLPRPTASDPLPFSLLVVSITFDYSGSHTVNFYVIPPNSPNLDLYPSPPTPDITFTVPGTTDLSFHSLAYFGGSSPNQSSIDEIRFGRDYQRAVLCSDRISIVRGLCQGFTGSNVYPYGDFGRTDLQAARGFASPASDEVVGTAGVWGDASPSPVIIKTAAAELSPSNPYSSIAPGYIYRPNDGVEPNDGRYVVANQTRQVFGWIKSYDNTNKDINGMLMLVNAAYAPSPFFRQKVDNICGGVQYEFFLDILNLFPNNIGTITNPGSYSGTRCDPVIEPGCQQFSGAATDGAGTTGIGGATSNICTGCQGYGINPQLEFLLGDPTNPDFSQDVIAYTPPVSVANDEKWHRVGFTFVTKAVVGATGLRLTIRNAAPGGGGNDLAIDNITFRPCGPVAALNPSFLTCSTSTVSVTLNGANEGLGFDSPEVQWQQWQLLYDTNGDKMPDDSEWQPVGGAVSSPPPGNPIPVNVTTLGLTDANRGRIRAIVAGAGSLNKPNCRVTSPSANSLCVVIPTPVTLAFFRAGGEGKRVRISWQTVFETSADYFVVERSQDGINYQEIGQKVTARGPEGRDARTNYQVYDETPMSGINYYRLRQVDKNTDFKIYGPESVDIEGQVTVFPNPAKENITIRFPKPFVQSKQVQIRMGQVTGKTVKNIQRILNPGEQEYVIPVSDLNSGVYIVEIVTDEIRSQYKVLIIH